MVPSDNRFDGPIPHKARSAVVLERGFDGE